VTHCSKMKNVPSVCDKNIQQMRGQNSVRYLQEKPRSSFIFSFATYAEKAG